MYLVIEYTEIDTIKTELNGTKINDYALLQTKQEVNNLLNNGSFSADYCKVYDISTAKTKQIHTKEVHEIKYHI